MIFGTQMAWCIPTSISLVPSKSECDKQCLAVFSEMKMIGRSSLAKGYSVLYAGERDVSFASLYILKNFLFALVPSALINSTLRPTPSTRRTAFHILGNS